MRTTALLLATSLLAACGLFDSGESIQEYVIPDIDAAGLGTDAPLFDPLAGQPIGASCEKAPSGASTCRFGLKCVEGACRTVQDTPKNYPCILDQECIEGNYCSLAGTCQPTGQGAAGDTCSTGGDCASGLYCQPMGMAGYCATPGEGDLHAPCATMAECMGGLLCNVSQTCEPRNVVFGLAPWPGVGATVCDNTPDDGPPRAYFEIPRDDVREFFRLPYPNDIRMRGGHIKLDGFPVPGPGALGFDPVQRIVDAIESVGTGFSTVPAVYFRFSAPVDFGSIVAGGDTPTIRFVNVDPDSPSYGLGVSYSWFVTDGGGKYICPRWLAVHAAWSSPLEPDTTYAILLTQGVKTTDGRALEQPADLALVLGGARPSDATEGAAWDAYTPLRAFLAEQSMEASTVIAASVFTTTDTHAVLPKLREAVQALPQEAPKDLTLCQGGATSPCDDGLTGDAHTRGCVESRDDLWELHMKVAIPMAQEGTRPYLEPADGGGLARDAQGNPALNGTEDVCVSLTIPKGASMPDAGWPLMIFGHGTGGNFRSAVDNVGAPLSHVDVEGTTVGAAVVGWDGPMHGPRRHSDLSPEVLFYNFGNPKAARGNLVQGAVDVFALTKTFKAFALTAEESPTGQAIRFDPTHIMLGGHSQGATTGPLAAPYEPDIKLDVWSGGGAGLILSLLNKTQPVDAKAGVAVALQEITDQGIGDVGDLHPALRLIQQFFDDVDPLNHAALEFASPWGDVGAQHVLQVYGKNDHFTPPATNEAFARVLRVQYVTGDPAVKEIEGLTKVAPPVTGNFHSGAVTGAVVMAAPDADYDGHFVLFRNAGARKQFQQFEGTWLVNGTPTVVAP